MEIKTKYNIGDNVCTLYHDRIVYGNITHIKIAIDYKTNVQIEYFINNSTYIGENVYFQEHTIFKTKEELLEKLGKNDYL
jgi:predicted acyltransferase (DUF342 family)